MRKLLFFVVFLWLWFAIIMFSGNAQLLPNCSFARNISITNAGNTETINLTLTSDTVNFTQNSNESNFSFTDLKNTSFLRWYVEAINVDVGNGSARIWVNISNNDTIWMRYNCRDPDLGSSESVFRYFQDFNTGLDGWVASGSGSCLLANLSERSSNTTVGRRGIQALVVNSVLGNNAACRSPQLNISSDWLNIDFQILTKGTSSNIFFVANTTWGVESNPNASGVSTLYAEFQDNNPATSYSDTAYLWTSGSTTSSLHGGKSVYGVLSAMFSAWRFIFNSSAADATVIGRWHTDGIWRDQLGDIIETVTDNGFKYGAFNDGLIGRLGIGAAAGSGRNISIDNVKVFVFDNNSIVTIGEEVDGDLSGQGLVENATYNLTDLSALMANYTITFFANTTDTPDVCYIKLSNGSEIEGTRNASTQICIVYLNNVNASQSLTATPKINTTPNNAIFSGGEQPLVIVRRSGVFQNHSLISNESLQHFLLQYDIDNRIDNDHNSTPFSHNSTSPKILLDILRLTNTSQNVSIDADVIVEKVGQQNGTDLMINQSGYWVSINLSIGTLFGLDIGFVPTIKLRGLSSGNVNVTNDSGNQLNFTLDNWDLNFSTGVIPGNATFNYSLNFSAKVANLSSRPSGATTVGDERHFFENVTIHWIFDANYNNSLDIGVFLNDFPQRSGENFSVLQPNGNLLPSSSVSRAFANGVIYAYTFTDVGLTGNHEARIVYLVPGGGGGTGGTGGGGGGGGGARITVVQFEEVNLSVSPSFIEKFCFSPFTVSNVSIVCSKIIKTNKKIKSCRPKLEDNVRVVNSCELIDNVTAVINTAFEGFGISEFSFESENEFEVAAEDGEIGTVTFQSKFFNLAHRVPGVPIFSWVLLLFLLVGFLFVNRVAILEALEG